MKNRQASEFYRRQADMLERQFITLYESLSPSVGATMADGGFPLSALAQVVGERVYFDIIGRLFRLPK